MNQLRSKREMVPVAPFREAFEASGLTLTVVAENAGWLRSNGQKMTADTSRVARRLGLKPAPSGPASCRRSYLTENLELGVAVVLVRAMGMDPVDFKEWGL